MCDVVLDALVVVPPSELGHVLRDKANCGSASYRGRGVRYRMPLTVTLRLQSSSTTFVSLIMFILPFKRYPSTEEVHKKALLDIGAQQNTLEVYLIR